MNSKKRLKPTIFLAKNRRGQFYLIAAVVVVLLIVGFATIYNYTHKKSSVRLYDLGDELGIESKNVLDYGTYNALDESAMNSLLEEFIDTYVTYAGDNKNLYFLFGNSNSVKVKAYQELSESVSVEGNPLTITDGEGEGTYTPSGGKIRITIEDFEYQFNLESGENFYFVLSQKIDGDKYVITG